MEESESKKWVEIGKAINEGFQNRTQNLNEYAFSLENEEIIKEAISEALKEIRKDGGVL